MKAPKARPATRRPAVSTNPRQVSFSGENLKDPKRADKLLRKFSWEREDA